MKGEDEGSVCRHHPWCHRQCWSSFTPKPLIFYIPYSYYIRMRHSLSFLNDFPYLTKYGCVSLLCNVVNRYNLKILFHYIYKVFHKLYNLLISCNVLQRTSTNNIARTSMLQRVSASTGMVGLTKACKAAIVWTYDVIQNIKNSPSVELWRLSHYQSISKDITTATSVFACCEKPLCKLLPLASPHAIRTASAETQSLAISQSPTKGRIKRNFKFSPNNVSHTVPV